MNRCRILHLRASNFVGGPEQQLLRHAELERNGAWDILLGTFAGPREGADFLQTIEARGLSAVSLPAGSLGSTSRALIKVIRKERIGLLCTHGYKADILGLLSARIAGIPLACFLRGWTGENRKVRFYESLDRFALRYADRVVCLSAPQAEKLSSHSAFAKKIRVVCNAIDVSAINPEIRLRARGELRQRFALPQGCVIVAAGGRLSPEKGMSDFLQAISQIRCQFPDVQFLIFGDGVLRKRLERNAHSYGLQGRITFAGFHRDLRRLLPGLDLLVNPSLSEEMPNIILEGMAAETPVIATAVGGVADLAGPEDALRLVPAGKPEILAKAIAELICRPKQANALAQAGRRRVEQAFSPAEQQSQLHTLYQELLTSFELRSPGAATNRSIAKNSPTVRCPAAPIESRQQAPSLQETVKQLPFISVVIPVKNEGAHIGAVLQDLLRQNYPTDRFEILVVDGNSTDKTRQVVKEFRERSSIKVACLANPAELSSAGRNVGAKAARGEFIVFIDGHCRLPSRTLLRDAAEVFESTGADCLCRPQPLTMSGNTSFQEVVAHARATSLGHGRDSTIYSSDFEGPVNPSSSGALYRREVFERVGYFDESFDACEDVELNYRVFKAGLRSYLSPRLTVLYWPRGGLRALFQQMKRYGRGRCRLIRKHASAFSISQVIPAVFLSWLIAGGILSFFSLRIAELLLGTLAVYGTVVLFFAVRLALRHGWRHLLLAPVIYTSIHLGLGAGFLAEAIRPARRSSRSGGGDPSTSFHSAARAVPEDSSGTVHEESSAAPLSGKGSWAQP